MNAGNRISTWSNHYITHLIVQIPLYGHMFEVVNWYLLLVVWRASNNAFTTWLFPSADSWNSRFRLELKSRIFAMVNTYKICRYYIYGQYNMEILPDVIAVRQSIRLGIKPWTMMAMSPDISRMFWWYRWKLNWNDSMFCHSILQT